MNHKKIILFGLSTFYLSLFFLSTIHNNDEKTYNDEKNIEQKDKISTIITEKNYNEDDKNTEDNKNKILIIFVHGTDTMTIEQVYKNFSLLGKITLFLSLKFGKESKKYKNILEKHIPKRNKELTKKELTKYEYFWNNALGLQEYTEKNEKCFNKCTQQAMENFKKNFFSVPLIGKTQTSTEYHYFLFSWSGSLAESKRTEAGASLCKAIDDCRKKYGKNSKIYIIAHSHGGNVVLESYHEFAKSDKLNNIYKNNYPFVDGAVFAGTPIYKKTSKFLVDKKFSSFINNLCFIYSEEDTYQSADWTIPWGWELHTKKKLPKKTVSIANKNGVLLTEIEASNLLGSVKEKIGHGDLYHCRNGMKICAEALYRSVFEKTICEENIQ